VFGKNLIPSRRNLIPSIGELEAGPAKSLKAAKLRYGCPRSGSKPLLKAVKDLLGEVKRAAPRRLE